MSKVEPYSFDPAFERAAVVLACTRPRFFGVLGHALDPAGVSTPAAKLALEAARAIAKDSGHGPESSLLVVQRLRRWMGEGRVTLEDIGDVADLFDSAEDAGLPPEDAVIEEVRPILQKRIRKQAVTAGMEEFGKGGDFSRVGELLSKAERIGVIDTNLGTKLGPASFVDIERLRTLDRLPLGVMELDSYLDGGLGRGGLGVIVGGPGDGKSMGLAHISGASVAGGFFVALATLELPREVQLARIKANITGIPINAILADSTECRAALEGMALGPCVVKDFAPLSTTVEDLRDWVKQLEDDAGRPVDLLAVDYADKLGAKTTSRSEDSGYAHGRIIYEGLRHFAFEKSMWCWTASQASRQKDKKKKLDLSDVADSMHKARVADLMVMLNLRGEEDALEMLFGIGKNRTGKSRASIGPLPCDFGCARIAPVLDMLGATGVTRSLAIDSAHRMTGAAP